MRTKMLVGWYPMNYFKNKLPQLLLRRNKGVNMKPFQEFQDNFFASYKCHTRLHPALGAIVLKDGARFTNSPVSYLNVIQSMYYKLVIFGISAAAYQVN